MEFYRGNANCSESPRTIEEVNNFFLKNVNYTPIINGKKTQTIKPSRRIRQRDPISPYIFILAMKYLNHLILENINTKQWLPFKFINKDPKISHMLFADILLFSKANNHI